MKRVHVASAVLILLLCSLFVRAQQIVATNTNVAVPPLINFSGVLTDVNGKPMTGSVAVTFSLYSEQTGGAALWMETQNVQLDSHGNYTVMLGSTSSTGLPAEIFVAGQAHWLGVQTEGQGEQPRVLLVSAPYALKAGDAETIGGLPPSAFLLAATPSGAATSNAAAASASTAATGSVSSDTTSDVTTTGGTVGTIAAFSTATNIQSSLLSQTEKTAINVAGKLNLPATGIATSSTGKNSQPFTQAASAYNSSTGSAVTQNFQWQAEPANNDTANPGGTLNLLFGAGTSTPAETGLNIASNGQITFAQGQTFPGTGTITGVTAGTGLSGGGTTGNLTISNTGVLGVSAGSGISLGGTLQNPTISNNGVLTVNGGSGISITGGQNPTFSNSGILTVTQGTGISVSSGQSPIIGINTAVVPQLAANNTFTGTQTINNTTVISGANSSGVLQVTNTLTSGAAPGIVGTTSSTNASGVKGVASATSGTTNGVYGTSSSTSGIGVKGSSNYIGVYGQASGASNEGQGFSLIDAGVWGDTGGESGDFDAVLGTADQNNAGAFYNNSDSSDFFFATIYAENDTSSTSGGIVLQTAGLDPDIGCVIYTNGDLSCTGTVSGVAPVDGGSRNVALYAIEGPENWFEDAGSAQLSNGAAVVNLEPVFGQTVNTDLEYHVFLTPNGDCKGLYVSQKTPTSFEVHELGGGTSSIAFDYRIMAKRKGYESVRLADKTNQFGAEAMQHQKMRRKARPSVAPRSGAVTSAPQFKAAAQPVPAQLK
jgi:hypothetical protein